MNAEDTAIGFGWVQEKNGKTYVKWERVNGFCKEFGFSPQVGKDDFIPETLFYLLGMKASNEIARKFQMWLATEVIPSIRKHGAFIADSENIVYEGKHRGGYISRGTNDITGRGMEEEKWINAG